MKYIAEYLVHPACEDGTPEIRVIGSISGSFQVDDKLVRDGDAKEADAAANGHAEKYPLQHHHDKPEECAVYASLYRDAGEVLVAVYHREFM